MHALHKIVVEAETEEEARDKANRFLEYYRNSAFDYFNDFAGAWKDDYPCAINSLADREKFLDLLEVVREMQEGETVSLLRRMSLSELTPLIRAIGKISDASEDEDSCAVFDTLNLKTALNLASGDYCFDSGFLDIDRDTGKVTNALLRDVEEGEKRLWMLFYDLHN